MISKIFKILTFIFVFFSFLITYADSTIKLSVNSNNIALDKELILTTDIETTNSGQVELLDINGLDDFIRIGKSSSNQISIVNGEKFSKFQIILTLKPNKIGKYNIGPVKAKIGEEDIISNELVVNIVNNKNKKETKDIKPIKTPYSDYYSFIFFQITIILLLIGLFIYLKFIKKDDKSLEQKESKKIEQKDYKKDLRKKIKHLINAAEIMNKSEFYENLNICFKDYFKILGFFDTETLTLKEIKKLDLEKKLISLFEQSYINEFSDKKDSPKTRKHLVNEFLEILK